MNAAQESEDAFFDNDTENSSEPELYDDDDELQNDSSFSRVSATIGETTPGSIEEVFFDTHEIHLPEKEHEFKPAPEYKEEGKADYGRSDIAEVAKEETDEFFDTEDNLGDKEFESVKEPSDMNGNDIEKSVPYSTSYENRPLEDEVPGAVIHPNSSYNMNNMHNVNNGNNGFDRILEQDHDGQIKMAVEPEVEKQITGQISISEYIQNWEQFKKDQQERQLESVKKKVSDQTGDLFADYDEITKAGLQEKIEKAISDAIKKEKQKRASGRGDWSRDNADIIDEAVDEVINNAEKAGISISRKDFEKKDIKGLDETSESKKSNEVFEREEFADLNKEVDTTEKEKDALVDDEKDTSTENNQNRSVNRSDIRSRQESRGERGNRPTTRPSERRPQNQRAEAQRTDNRESDQGAKRNLRKHRPGNKEIEERLRKMTPEEKELFGPYIHHKKSRRQIIKAIDNMSMDAFSGNVIVTGEEGAGTINLAKGLIRAVQASNSAFNGKVAKITANTLNKKGPSVIFEKIANGALIVQRAADIMPETAAELIKILKEGKKSIIIVMEDTKEDMNKFLDVNPDYKDSFSVRVDIEALDDESLVAYARQYALENEYAIDNLGILALHTKISERQTLDHDVTVSEVRDIVDDAIYYAEKRSVSHFVDIIVNKRFDENDMIILREKDFMH